MIILDTDHFSALKYSQSQSNRRLIERIESSPDQDFATTVITLEEQMRGWLARIHRISDIHDQVPAYARLANLFSLFNDWTILSFDTGAADQFDKYRKSKIRLASMDLKIASIAVTRDCLLLTANEQHFEQIPGLRFENWLN